MQVLMQNPLKMSTISDILVFELLLHEFGHILVEKLRSNMPFIFISSTVIIREDATSVMSCAIFWQKMKWNAQLG